LQYYAAVLMDCQMPEMDGYAATAMIRAHEGEARHTPIIAMTANALPGDRQRCLDAGMDDYLAKPVKSETLAAVLERWVQRTHATPAGAPSPDPDAALDQAIDPLALANLRDLQDEGDPDIVGEVIEQFLSDAPRRLASLSQAVRQQDAHALEREAHTLKGSCLALGARPMADIAEELQALGRAQSLAPAAEVLARLEREFTRVHAALSAELVEV
jgi:DNA-binding response OmpR family regulator